MKTSTLPNTRTRILVGLLVAELLASNAAVAAPRFNLVKPSTTGVPGEEVRVMKIDPAGNLWIARRFYFSGDARLALLPAKQLKFRPLPGGGFDTGARPVG